MAASFEDRGRAFVVYRDGEVSWFDFDAPLDRAPSIAGEVSGLVVCARAVRDGLESPRPAFSSNCPMCPWRDQCRAELDAADDVKLVARIGRSVRNAMAPMARTVAELAALDLDAFGGSRTPPPGLGADRLRRSRDRARLLSTPDSAPFARRPLGLDRYERELHFDLEADALRDLIHLHGVVELVGAAAIVEYLGGVFERDIDGDRMIVGLTLGRAPLARTLR